MGANNADFHGSRKFYHVSPREHRESIEATGLKPIKPWDDEPAGVYMSQYEPAHEYGDDVYEVHPTEVHEDTGDWSNSVFSPNHIPTSDFKRVGHVYFNPSGHTEVHWHLEEHCPNK
jgi:hypothetical protein